MSKKTHKMSYFHTHERPQKHGISYFKWWLFNCGTKKSLGSTECTSPLRPNTFPSCHYFHIHRYKLSEQTCLFRKFESSSVTSEAAELLALISNTCKPLFINYGHFVQRESQWNITDCTLNISYQQSLAFLLHKSYYTLWHHLAFLHQLNWDSV